MKKKGFVTIFKSKRTLVLLLFIFLSLSAVIATVTFYGQNVGNLTIDLDDKLSKVGIAMSDEPNFETQSNRLFGDVLGEAKPISQSVVFPEFVTDTDGSFKSVGGDYIGFTFYLKNVGNEAVSIQAILRITEVTRNVDAAVRVWVFEDEENAIYQKPDDVVHDYPSSYKPTTHFDSSTMIFQKTYKDFLPEEVKKFSIILWIEGEDPDCTNIGDKPIEGGTFKTGMSFQSYIEEK